MPSPPFQAALTIRSADGSTEIARVTTDQAGAFAIPLDPGTYLVDAPATSAGSASQSLAVTVAPDAPTPLTIRVRVSFRQ